MNGQVCDTESFGPKLFAEDGHHAGVWNDSNCVASGTVRKVTSLVLVRVNQGKLPLWSSERPWRRRLLLPRKLLTIR